MTFAEETWTVARKTQASLDRVDAMSAGMRRCVHEYGEIIVMVLHKHGIRRPEHIDEIVKEIWEGARQHRQRRPLLGTLDWLLVQNGCDLSSATLGRILHNNSMAIVATEPTRAMLDASMRECSEFRDRVTKEEKHRRRLRAAVRAGAIGVQK